MRLFLPFTSVTANWRRLIASTERTLNKILQRENFNVFSVIYTPCLSRCNQNEIDVLSFGQTILSRGHNVLLNFFQLQLDIIHLQAIKQKNQT